MPPGGKSMARKNILYLIKSTAIGGAERLLLTTLRHLDHDSWNPTVSYVLPRQAELAPEMRRAGAEVVCLADEAPWPVSLRREVHKRSIDLIHAHSPLPAAVARVVVDRHLPFIYTEHNVWPSYRPGTRLANAITYRRNNHVFAVSDEVRRSIRLLGLGVRAAPPLETLYHGVEPADVGAPPALRKELGLAPDALLIGAVGSLKRQKGHDVLIDAFAMLRGDAPIHLAIVGDGPLRDALVERAERNGVSDRLSLLGHRADARHLMTAFDVYAAGSRYEGLPIALLEAMAASRAVVVTAVGGVREVVEHEKDGLIVAPENPAALAAALRRVLTDESLRRYLGEGARIKAASFDPARAVKRMHAVYRQVLAPRPGGQS